MYENANFKEIQNLFDITQKLVSKNQEIMNGKSIGSKDPSWTRSNTVESLPTKSFCFDKFTQRISSVFTEQSQIGVKCWVGPNPKKKIFLVSRHKS